MTLTTAYIESCVQQCLDAFYTRRIAKLSTLRLADTLRRKNPYLFRAVGIESATELVGQLLSA